MTNSEARRQLCKMAGEIAGRLGIGDWMCGCTCGQGIGTDNPVPDKVISEMWRRLTSPHWKDGEKKND